MATVRLPLIPDVPRDAPYAMYEFLLTLKETLEVLTGQVGANTKLIDYMRLTGRLMGGVGSPENVVAAPIGTLYLREDGSTDTTLYTKEAGDADTTTGWAAM